VISKNVYDTAGRVQFAIQDLDDNLTTTADQLTTQYIYDAAGRQTRVVDALGHETNFEYDKVGRQVATIGPRVFDPTTGAQVHLRSETVFDDLGRRVQTIENVKQITPGDASSINRGEQRITDYAYDNAGRLTTVTLPAVDDAETPATTLVHPAFVYQYDQYGNQTVIRDPKGHETQLRYDEQQRQVARKLPNTLTETKKYNDLGQLELAIDLEGRHTRFIYDSLGRLDKKESFANAAAYSAGTVSEFVRYTYDALGRQTKIVQDGDGIVGTLTDQRVTINTFDTFGRLTQINSPQGILNHSYDNVSRTTRTWSSTAVDGLTAITDTTYGYDALGRPDTVTAVKRNGTTISETTEYRYDKNGNLDLQKLPGNLVTDYVYDAMNRLVELRNFNDANDNGVFDGTDTRLSEYLYTLAVDGQRKRVVEKNDQSNDPTTIDWVYDALGRLIEERRDTPTGTEDYMLRWAYDLASNRVRMEKDLGNAAGTFVADESTTYAYDVNDRLLSEIFDGISDTNTRYTYTNTQQTGKTVRAGLTIDQGAIQSQTTYSYDLQGRTKQIAANVGGTITTTSYKYNDDGFRVSQTETIGAGAPVTTLYHVASNNPTGFDQVLEEGTDANADGRLQVSEVGKTFALGLDVISQGNSAATVYHLLYDGHGSTRAVANTAGLVQQRYAYDAYGKMLPGSGLTTDLAAAFTSLLYSGEKTDKTGLQYLRSRYYDPSNGRFTSFDSFAGNMRDPQSLHKYLYVHANPIMGVDPSGREFSVAGLSASIGIGMAISVGDAFIRGERGWDLADDAIIGGVTGAIAYPIFAANAAYRLVRIIQASTLLVGTGFGVYGTASAISEGNYGLAAYRGVFTVLGGMAFKAKLDTLRLPQGFKSVADYNKFVDATANALKNIGADDASIAIRGSAVTGRSGNPAKAGSPFGPGSDVDLAVASESLLARCVQLGLTLRGGRTRTGPLRDSDLAQLGLSEIAAELSAQLGRPVTFMIYDSVESVIARGAAWLAE
jgi:RHS repeat-associated protein